MAKRGKTSQNETPAEDVAAVESQDDGRPPLIGRLLLRLFRPRLLCALAAVILFVVALPRIARLLPDLERHPDYQLQLTDIELTERPGWVPHDLIEQVSDRAGLPPEISMLESGWTATLAEAFRLHPWVKSVHAIRCTGPGRVIVDLEYRRPVAMVEVRMGVYPVDAEGVLLPPADFSVRDTRRYCLIRNCRTTPQGPAGTPWGDPAVAGAARIAAALMASTEQASSYWRQLRLTSIEVPQETPAGATLDDLVFRLTTLRGSRILWGRAPGTRHPGELSTEQKLGRLEKYLARLDDGSGPYEIDIRHWREITYQPLTAGRRHERGVILR